MVANNTPTMWSPKFTDEDLANLKKCVIPETQKLDVGLFMWESHSPVATNLAALISRLEAAERFIEVGALTQSVTPTELATAELKWREVLKLIKAVIVLAIQESMNTLPYA